MLNKLTMAKAQGNLERLEKIFEKWMRKKIGNEEFAAQAIIEILEAKRIISKLISKSME